MDFAPDEKLVYNSPWHMSNTTRDDRQKPKLFNGKVFRKHKDPWTILRNKHGNSEPMFEHTKRIKRKCDVSYQKNNIGTDWPRTYIKPMKW